MLTWLTSMCRLDGPVFMLTSISARAHIIEIKCPSSCSCPLTEGCTIHASITWTLFVVNVWKLYILSVSPGEMWVCVMIRRDQMIQSGSPRGRHKKVAADSWTLYTLVVLFERCPLVSFQWFWLCFSLTTASNSRHWKHSRNWALLSEKLT